MSATNNLCLVIIAILAPPLAVFLMTGCSCDLLINVCLTILGVLPGHIHAFYLIYKKSNAEEQFGAGNIKYHGNGEYHPRQPHYGGAQPVAPLGAQTYGTIPQ